MGEKQGRKVGSQDQRDLFGVGKAPKRPNGFDALKWLVLLFNRGMSVSCGNSSENGRQLLGAKSAVPGKIKRGAVGDCYAKGVGASGSDAHYRRISWDSSAKARAAARKNRKRRRY